ncbi:MAG: hypothetical protein WCD49_15885 [Candidatus Acidiferrales bacterium]
MLRWHGVQGSPGHGKYSLRSSSSGCIDHANGTCGLFGGYGFAGGDLGDCGLSMLEFGARKYPPSVGALIDLM